MNQTKTIKSYSDVIKLNTFEDRLKFLMLYGIVGNKTFGYNRVFNQMFYLSYEWLKIRDYVIVRDNGCDLAIPGREIFGSIYVHHLNPISIDDIKNSNRLLLDPENLICASFDTHNSIHYGYGLAVNTTIERKPGDTCPWKH